MKKTFIQTNEFSKRWDELKLSDDDLRKLELLIIQKPHLGKVIRGTGGLRKIRLSLGSKGKSGGARVCYIDFINLDTIYLITIYRKKEKDNLSFGERNQIKKMILELEKSLNWRR